MALLELLPEWLTTSPYVVGFGMYVAAWVFATDWHTAMKLPQHLPFWLGVVCILFSSSAAGYFNLGCEGMIAAALGGAAMFGTAVLHHPSNGMAIAGAAILASLGQALQWQVTSGPAAATMAFVFAVFAIGYMASTPSESNARPCWG
jgi:hypothetical protein